MAVPGNDGTDFFDDGYVAYTNGGGDIQHSITNVADETHCQIIVELKGSTRRAKSGTNGRVRLG